MCELCDGYEYGEHIPHTDPHRLRIKKSLPKDVHLPNKNEAKVLRRIMSETGMSEKEVREHKKYRIELSKAQKVKHNPKSHLKGFQHILKSVTRELKLPKEHPDVIKLYLERCKKNTWGHRFSYGNPMDVFSIKKNKSVKSKQK